MTRPIPRWFYGLIAVVIQLCLGAGYSWTVFRVPLQEAYGWTYSTTADPFRYLLLAYTVGMTSGGWLQDRWGPRIVATLGGLLVSLGCVLGALIGQSPLGMSLGYATLCGLGMGFAYVPALAVLVKWFPDKRGFIVGLAVMGFGAGPILSAPIQTMLLGGVKNNYPKTLPLTFWIMAIAFLVLVVGLAQMLKNPPDTYATTSAKSEINIPPRQVLGMWQIYALWCVLLCSSLVGLGVLSEAAPYLGRLTSSKPLIGASVGVMALCNGIGRLLSGILSDRLGRERVLSAVFALGIIDCLVFLPSPMSYAQGFIGMCIAAFCFGAGIAMMPSTNADYFGSKYLGSNYGMMFTGFAISGFFGPKIVADIVQQNPAHGYRVVFWAFAGISFIGLLLSLILRKPHSNVESHPTVE